MCQSYNGYTRSIILPRLVTQNIREKKARSHAARALSFTSTFLLFYNHDNRDATVCEFAREVYQIISRKFAPRMRDVFISAEQTFRSYNLQRGLACFRIFAIKMYSISERDRRVSSNVDVT